MNHFYAVIIDDLNWNVIDVIQAPDMHAARCIAESRGYNEAEEFFDVGQGAKSYTRSNFVYGPYKTEELAWALKESGFNSWTVNFRGEECHVRLGHYNNGRLAITLITETGEPMAVATVNLPDEDIMYDSHVFIKDWSENEGMLDALVRSGVISPELHESVSTGHVYAYEAQLSEAFQCFVKEYKSA